MSRAVAVSLVLLSFSAGIAQVPPGYRILQVTEGPGYDSVPRLNNVGQIVFSRRIDPQYGYTSEIFLYDANTRELTRLTNDDVIDWLPDINDNGTIVWSRAFDGGFSALEIVRLEKGVLTRLTQDNLGDEVPRINENGEIVWYKWHAEGCDNDSANIYLYDGQSIVAITNDLWSNVVPDINNLGHIVWSQRDFCPAGYWTAKVMMYAEGTISQLSSPTTYKANSPRVSNTGYVSWTFQESAGAPRGIQVWRDGVITQVTDWGLCSGINEGGDIYFIRWHESNQTWQAWLRYRGEFHQLSDDPFWNVDGDINGRSECVWQSGQYPEGDIRFLQRSTAGDLNCDGSVNPFDIQPFVVALSDPDGYAGQYPGCDILLADANEDGSVNQFDIQAFIELLAR